MIKSESKTGIKDLIHTSVTNKNVISILYQKDNGSLSNRKLYPIIIQEYNNHEYLEAFCLLRNNNRIFKLANIKSIIFYNKKYEGVYYSKLKVFGSVHNTIDANKKFNNKVDIQKPLKKIVKPILKKEITTKKSTKPSIKKQEQSKEKNYEGYYAVIFIVIIFLFYLYVSS